MFSTLITRSSSPDSRPGRFIVMWSYVSLFTSPSMDTGKYSIMLQQGGGGIYNAITSCEVFVQCSLIYLKLWKLDTSCYRVTEVTPA